MQTFAPITWILLIIAWPGLTALSAFEISHPAVNACIGAGGLPETVELEEGEMSICAFDRNGNSVISSWALVYAQSKNREEGQELPAAITAFFSDNNKIPTGKFFDDWQTLPAINCTQNLGGEVRKVFTAEGKKYDLCFFPVDNSAIGTATLFMGPFPQGPNRRLVTILQAAMETATE